MAQRKVRSEVKATICGTCEGLNRRSLLPAVDGKSAPTCGANGVAEKSKACARYRPDVFSMPSEDREAIRKFLTMMQNLSESGLKILLATVENEYKTRQQGVRAGTPVYVRYRSYRDRNYLDNFALAYVVDAREREIRLMSGDGSMMLTYQREAGCDLTGPTLYSEEAFKPIYDDMVANNRLSDPKAVVLKRNLPKEDVEFTEYSQEDFGIVVAEINLVLTEPKQKRGRKPAAKPKRQQQSTVIDLCNMAGAIDSGHINASDDDDDEPMSLGDPSYRRSARRNGKTTKPRAQYRRSKGGDIDVTSLVRRSGK